MKTMKLYKRDLILGLFRRLFLYLLPVLIAFLQVRSCYDMVNPMFQDGVISSMGTVADYFLYCTRGMAVYQFNPEDMFSVPVFWFMFQIGISYIIAYYAMDDYQNNGRNLFLAIRNRKSWWTAKCLWCLTSVVVYFVIYAGSLMAWSIAYGAKWDHFHITDFIETMFGNNIGYFSTLDMIFCAVVVPCFITMGICLMQIVGGFFTTPVFSFAIVCGVYILSAYYTKWWLPGSYTMWLRSSYYTVQGIRPISGILFSLLLIFLAWYSGRTYFKIKDVP